jgi:hypothetical protein
MRFDNAVQDTERSPHGREITRLIGYHRWCRVLKSAMSLQGNARIFACFILFATAGFVPVLSGAANAEAGKVPRLGILRDGQPPQSYIEAFQRGLRELRYVDGRNVAVEFRFGTLDQLPQLAAELVRLKVAVIVASPGSAALAAKRTTTEYQSFLRA